ncbi:MAG TPA: ATP-binding protein [Pyrinomonadaceae bacterium]|nr:ATP-binding protein [Pyrinomonadaceae bacterium]
MEPTLAGSDLSHDILRGILNASRESVLVVDPSMRITAANDPAIEAFARQMETLHGRRLTEIIRDVGLHEGFQHTLTNNVPTDLRIDFNGVEKRSFDVHIAPVQLEGARHAIGVFYDITQIDRLEKVRQEFLSNISHELRTPLTSIIAYVETLQDGAIDEPENAQRFLGIIRRNAERMNALIADIAELSLIETGNVSLDIREVTLSNAVEEIFAALSARAANRNVSLVNKVERDTHVRADLMRLEQMLTNLVDNAIKFNREGGTVTVIFSQSSGKSLISVGDTGEGIVPENLQRIFERFYRIDRGRTRKVGGTGLGLAIVKHLARLHGGEVFVTSALGRGTTFSIELPF